METKFKLGLGIPLSWHYVPSDFFDSCMEMNLHDAHMIRASSGPIHEMRNLIARRALEMDCTHLMFLDADMTYPPDTITKLLSHNLDIVGGLTFKRWPDFEPILYTGKPYRMTLMDPLPKDGELVEVTATGTGCLLINIKLFVEMKYPWFEFGKSPEGKPCGEDINFCYRARELGYDVFVDTSILTSHITQLRVNWNWYHLHKKLKESGQGQCTF